MNLNIKKLAEQAGIDTEDFENAPVELYGAEQQLTQFAQLIVRECLSYMSDGDIDFAKFMIKKNFGVEE